jgi:hypothetical protein
MEEKDGCSGIDEAVFLPAACPNTLFPVGSARPNGEDFAGESDAARVGNCLDDS